MPVYELALYNPVHALKPSILTTALTHIPGVNWVVGAAEYCYSGVVVKWLARLYLYGPSINGWGFWEGREPEDICASLTGSPAEFWAQNLDECNRRISQNFTSFVVAVETVVFLLVSVQIIAYLLRRCLGLCSGKSK